jgi:hypothetical protein
VLGDGRRKGQRHGQNAGKEVFDQRGAKGEGVAHASGLRGEEKEKGVGEAQKECE